VNGSTIPPITEEAHLAYQSILRALETNWVAPSLESSGPHSGGVRPSSDTICELKTVLHMVALGRLGFDLATYHSIIKMLEDQRVILPPEQMGPLISHAVFIAHDEQRGLCRSVGVDDCSADDLDKARRDAPDNNREAIKAQRKRYCLSVQLGASIVKMAESSKHGVSLLARAQQYLRPLSDADIVAHGRAMKAEEAACFSEK
jgi:hypothetical protein